LYKCFCVYVIQTLFVGIYHIVIYSYSHLLHSFLVFVVFSSFHQVLLPRPIFLLCSFVRSHPNFFSSFSLRFCYFLIYSSALKTTMKTSSDMKRKAQLKMVLTIKGPKVQNKQISYFVFFTKNPKCLFFLLSFVNSTQSACKMMFALLIYYEFVLYLVDVGLPTQFLSSFFHFFHFLFIFAFMNFVKLKFTSLPMKLFSCARFSYSSNIYCMGDKGERERLQ